VTLENNYHSGELARQTTTMTKHRNVSFENLAYYLVMEWIGLAWQVVSFSSPDLQIQASDG
jgi:hypothetical protein